MTFTNDPPVIESLELIPDFQQVIEENAGGITEVSTFANLPAAAPPALAFVQDTQSYYYRTTPSGTPGDLRSSTANNILQVGLSLPNDFTGASKFFNGGDNLLVPDFGLGSNGQGGFRVFRLQNPYDLGFAVNTDTFAVPDFGGFGVRGGDISPDGTRLYVNYNFSSQYKQFQFDLDSPYDFSNLTQTGQNNYGLDDAYIYYSPDFEYFYITFDREPPIEQYEMSTPGDIDTATQTASITGQSGRHFGVGFNTDGTIMYESLRNSKYAIYDLSNPYEINSATFDQEVEIRKLDTENARFAPEFDDTGKTAFFPINDGRLVQYSVSEGGWDLIE